MISSPLPAAALPKRTHRAPVTIRRAWLLIVSPLLLAFQPGPTTAKLAPQFLMGKDLLARCSNAASWDYCYGYIVSVYDTSRAYATWLKVEDICVPDGILQGELVAAVVAYLKGNTQGLESQAASVVLVALQSRYPCASSVSAKTGQGASHEAERTP